MGMNIVTFLYGNKEKKKYNINYQKQMIHENFFCTKQGNVTFP